MNNKQAITRILKQHNAYSKQLADALEAAVSGEDANNVFAAYEQEIGMLTPIISDKVDEAVKEYSADWVLAAIQIAVENNARNWAYIEAILKRWKVDGFKSDKRVYSKTRGKKTAMEIVNEWGKELGYE